MDAHSKLEIVLNEAEENEEEKRFNEIICYDSGVSDEESNEFEQCDVSIFNETFFVNTSRIPTVNLELSQVLFYRLLM